MAVLAAVLLHVRHLVLKALGVYHIVVLYLVAMGVLRSLALDVVYKYRQLVWSCCERRRYGYIRDGAACRICLKLVVAVDVCSLAIVKTVAKTQ